MRTTLTIDDSVMSQVVQITWRSNPLDAIREALQSYLQQEKFKKVIAMRGKLDLNDNWQALRQLESRENGVALLLTDALIAAIANRHKAHALTLDHHFSHLKVQLA